MIDSQRFEQIISQKRNDLFAQFSRFCLAGLEAPYHLTMSCRNLFYDIGLKKISKTHVPVISVGNLTMGGTGKTPFVRWLVQKCLEMGLRPSVASRGYHADDSGWNDEAKELAFHFQDLPQAISPKRYTAINQMLLEAKNQEKPIDVVILDDGFQHRQLHRDLDIVLLDALNPFGYNHICPRGTLRESISSLKRADFAILSRSDFVDDQEKERIRKTVLSMNPNLRWCEIKHIPDRLVSFSHSCFSLNDMKNKKVFAFCGIGNPENFLQSLESNNIHVVDFLIFPDHFDYGEKALKEIACQCQKSQLRHILCTMKDLIKIKKWDFPEISLHALVTKTEITKGEADVNQGIGFLHK